MKKQTIISTLALSSIALLTFPVTSANEVPTSSETVVVVADTPVVTSPVDVPINQPTEPIDEKSTPTPTPSEPSGKPTDTPTVDPIITSPVDTPIVETPTEKPNVEEKEKSTEKEEKEDRETETKPVEQPKQNGLPRTDKKEEAKPAEPVLPVEPTVIPTPETPVIAETGAVIVSTQDSQVIVRETTGELKQVSPESIGATKQANGTIAIKDNTGKMQILPETGDDSSLLASALGMMSLVFSAVLKVLKIKVIRN